ncbi:MAG: hypothetical protein EU548_03885 [Promethearchaeota archaeon]|nr:MAG: hypothetical protein EU548_03885 [Candidatus Lokiarchaeota archaeon]
MEIPEGIEGDYLETKTNHLFFDVKGLRHPKDRKICFVRFYPNPEGDRLREGLKYKKIYNLQERYAFLKAKFPQYIFYSEQLDLEVQGVELSEIKKIYTPRDYIQRLRRQSEFTRLEQCSLELCDLFIEEGKLPEKVIGITGSPMVGLNKAHSDIDLIIYGTQASRDFQEHLYNILTSGGYCRGYNLEEYHSHYEWRAGGSDIPFDRFLQCEKRKQHQGMYKGFEFFIRYIKSPEDWKGGYYDYKYQNYGRIKVDARILDAKDALFTPCSYKIEVLKVLEMESPFSDFQVNALREVNSYRGRFCEQAIKGERVSIEGKLEKVIYKNEEEYFRILLRDQTTDHFLLLRD